MNSQCGHHSRLCITVLFNWLFSLRCKKENAVRKNGGVTYHVHGKKENLERDVKLNNCNTPTTTMVFEN